MNLQLFLNHVLECLLDPNMMKPCQSKINQSTQKRGNTRNNLHSAGKCLATWSHGFQGQSGLAPTSATCKMDGNFHTV
jgi:hypothetical protein